MARILLICLLVIAAVSVSACQLYTPAEPPDPSDSLNSNGDPPSHIADNSLTINGAGYVDAVIAFERNDCWVGYDPDYGTSEYLAHSMVTFAPTPDGEEVKQKISLAITFRGTTRSTTKWKNMAVAQQSVGATLDIGAEKWRSIDGETYISLYSSVGNKVWGSFSGRMVSEHGDTIWVSDGHIDADRTSDFERESPLSGHGFWLEGDGYKKQWIALDTVESNAVWWSQGASSHFQISSGVKDFRDGELEFHLMIPGQQLKGYLWSPIKSQYSGAILHIGSTSYDAYIGTSRLEYVGPYLGTRVQGQFEGTLINRETGEELRISDGEFSAFRVW